MLTRRFITALMLIPIASQAHAASGPQHLISWAAQLYDASMAQVVALADHNDNRYRDGQLKILAQVKPLLLSAELAEWTRVPVTLSALEAAQYEPTQFQMALSDTHILKIHWVEEHLNLVIEEAGEHSFTFMLLGQLESVPQEGGETHVAIAPQPDMAHFQFHHAATQEQYFPGLIVEQGD
jgi:hypothetical protein